MLVRGKLRTDVNVKIINYASESFLRLVFEGITEKP